MREDNLVAVLCISDVWFTGLGGIAWAVWPWQDDTS